ncbi:hypothetical protein [Chelativorans alearense]|uniref:hypothetical protein n=1 Tax=Chelativorans alearense TaxID=2681495 RepID=UPI001FEA3081|nr:hypothetical protein [Chelativorans alearense]
MAGDWTDEQNDAIVADYFAMLANDIAGRSYSKAKHNGLLQAVIGRSRGSIEYKHQNISAVLKGVGEESLATSRPLIFRRRSWMLWCAGSITIRIDSRRPRGWEWACHNQRSARKRCFGSVRRRRIATHLRLMSSSR